MLVLKDNCYFVYQPGLKRNLWHKSSPAGRVKRDYQRSRVYDSELYCAMRHPNPVSATPGKHLSGVLAEMVYQAVMDDRFVELFGSPSFYIKFFRKRGRSCVLKGSTDVIAFSIDGSICGYDVAHELAHVVCPPDAKHGPLFAEAMLVITGIIFGKSSEETLHSAYRGNRVSITTMLRK